MTEQATIRFGPNLKVGQQRIAVFGIRIFAWSNERTSGYSLVSEIFCHNSFLVRLNEYPDAENTFEYQNDE